MHIPGEVAAVMAILKNNGCESYIVGAPVRDLVLGLKPKDYDIATNCIPNKVLEIFRKAGWITVTSGINYGVVKVVHPKTKFDIDIATYRMEYYPLDYKRKVVEIKFSDRIEDDLSRRDFTINAMAMDEKGRIIDLFGGLRDISLKIIRFVGDARERIREDPLRMLRAVRFAVSLGFKIDAEDKEIIRDMSDKIQYISRERIGEEILKALGGREPWRLPRLLYETMLYKHILPEIGKMAVVRHDYRYKHYGETVLQHTEDVMHRMHHILTNTDIDVSKTKRILLMMSALLHDIGKVYTVKIEGGKISFPGHDVVGAKYAYRIVKDFWRLPDEYAKYVKFMTEKHMYQYQLEEAGFSLEDIASRMYSKFKGLSKDLLLLAFADSGEPKWLTVYDMIAYMEERASIKPLLTGHDIMAIYNVTPGPEVGRLKSKLFEIQLRENITDRNELIRVACEKYRICPQ